LQGIGATYRSYMSGLKFGVLGVVITLGGLSAGWGLWYGAVVAIGFVIVFVGDELITAVKEQTAWLQDDLENDLAAAAQFNATPKLDLSAVPSELAVAAMFREAK
jgi:hypothetical protein